MSNPDYLEDLGDNLILRRSTAEDAAALGKFNGLMHADPGEEFVEHIDLWVKELLSGRHPTFNSDDFTIVEDTSTGEIVSSLCLIDQVWAYAGIQFTVGRPELVATHPDYRRRGLVRKQFETVHGWSADRGQKLQYITGIPWYYRQFGYEMAVNLGGGRLGSIDHAPKLKADQDESCTIRPAVETDIPFLTELYAHSTQRSLLSCVRDQELWYYKLRERSSTSTHSSNILIIEDLKTRPIGYLLIGSVIFGGKVSLQAYELSPGISWLEVTPAVQRKVKQIGEEIAKRDSTEEKKVELHSISYQLGEDHPCYHVSHPNSMSKVNKPYAYYIRVPDLPDFITTIAPALEERLENSLAAGYSGELKLNFFSSGMILTFNNGKIKSAVSWENPDREKASTHLPDLIFLQLLFGYRSYDELIAAFPDMYSNNYQAAVLLRILFPRQVSLVYDLA